MAEGIGDRRLDIVPATYAEVYTGLAERFKASMTWHQSLIIAALTIVPFSIASTSLDAEPVQVSSSPVPLNAENPAQVIVGGLRYLGGIVVTSENIRFGGLSGLIVEPDGVRLSAVSDQGDWLTGVLTYSGAGEISGLIEVEMNRLLDISGRAVHSKRESDSEALAQFDGDFVVSFERNHRVWRYDKLGAIPLEMSRPPDIEDAPNNGGIEALTSLPDGRILAIAQNLRNKQGNLRGWLYASQTWHDLTLVATGDFVPTDLATLPSGDVLLLERSFSWLTGPAARISRIAAIEIQDGSVLVSQEVAVLSSPLTVDNMEGLAVINSKSGPRLYIVSDDNFNPSQKTLILVFKFLNH